MFNTLKRLYDEGRLTKDMLQRAVSKTWITQAQADEIIGVA